MSKKKNDKTLVTKLGRNSKKCNGMVNPPLYQTSTILFPNLKAYQDAEHGDSCYEDGAEESLDASYGLGGTPTTAALKRAIYTLEGGTATFLAPSGLSAVTSTLLCLLSPGDHVLVADSVYGPTRRFCHKELKRLGVETTYYDPKIGKNIGALIKGNTKVIFTESPGSITFEVQDIPAIAKAKGDALLVIDNSYATPLYFKPFEHGVDVSIQAITKYLSGHSDVIMGSVTVSEAKLAKRFAAHFKNHGIGVSPVDAERVLKGLRTMSVRLEAQQEACMKVVDWLYKQPEVEEIFYPAHPKSKDHALWKRDMGGGASLFSFVLKKKYSDSALAAMIDNMEHFAIGCSWGGYESLILALDPNIVRSATKFPYKGSLIRIYVGLEDADDLIEDLKKGLKRLK